MGAGASKTAQKTTRKFPNRAPGSVASSPPPLSQRAAWPPPSPKHPTQASYSKDEAIRADAIDPQLPESMNPSFSNRLRQMGVAQPNPTYSSSSTASHMPPQQTSSPIFPTPAINPTLSALEARQRLEREAEDEFDKMGLSGSQGRQYMNSGMIRDVLVLRERGVEPAEIEHHFNLRSGVLQRLGAKGLVAPLQAGGDTAATPMQTP